MAARSKTILLPLERLETKYADNTKVTPDTQFTDSFLIEACNALLTFECAKRLKAALYTPIGPEAADTAADTAGGVDDVTIEDRASQQAPRMDEVSRCSPLVKDTAGRTTARERIRAIASRAGADLVIVPYACTIRYHVYRPAGWRSDKYESSHYARPTTYMATTSFHLQVWNKDGTLMFEKIGTSVTDRPLFYTVFHKEQPTGTDIIGFAKRIYAPPLIKSLYKAIKIALILI